MKFNKTFDFRQCCRKIVLFRMILTVFQRNNLFLNDFVSTKEQLRLVANNFGSILTKRFVLMVPSSKAEHM